MYDFFGVWFEGNPWMGRNFLLDPDTPVKFPLRKDVPVVREFYIVDREFPGLPVAPPQPKPAAAPQKPAQAPAQPKPAQQAPQPQSGQPQEKPAEGKQETGGSTG